MTKDEREVLKAFRQCVFNVVFNNRDDHPKNFSFFLDRKKNWKLTPAYDLTFSPGPGGEHHMDICGEGQSPGWEQVFLLAEKGGISKKACVDIVDRVLSVAGQFKKESKKSPIRAKTLNRIDQVIQSNMKNFRNGN